MFAQSRAEWAEAGLGEMLSTDKDGALHHRRPKFPYVGNTGSQQAGASAWTAISLSHHISHHPKARASGCSASAVVHPWDGTVC